MMGLGKYILPVISLLVVNTTTAQNYHAINGSVYGGSLSAGGNPASLVFVPYSWDITPLAFQFKQGTNAYVIKNFSLLSPSGDVTAENSFGIKKRFVFGNADLRLFNARFNLNATSAIAFGANLRTYFHGTSGKTNYQDTSYSLADFQRINLDNQPLNAEGTASAWSELYASYSRTIKEDGYSILNAGITVKWNRSLAGGYIRGNDIRYTIDNDPTNLNGFILNNGTLQYGYSSNFDRLDSNSSLNSFLQNTATGFSFDAGVEYIFLSTEEEDDADDYAYKTKIGVSIMDIGSDRYQYSNRSRFGNTVKAGINDTLLESKFKPVKTMDAFNDSLATIADPLITLSGNFTIYKPARLVVNVDHCIQPNFFINASLTLPLVALAGKNYLYVKDMNLLAITPRWENRMFGAYMPVLYNMRNQLMVGGAFRAGPLLLGVHNLANIVSKSKMQNGGLYMALTIRPGKSHGHQSAPGNKINKQQLKRLKCTSF